MHIRSVRTRILILVLVPVLLLFGLYLFTAEHQARATDLRLLLSGLGLLAVVLSIIASLLVGRRLVRELSELRRSAEELADHRLPRMVDQLATGLDVDLDDDSPDVPVKTREIAQVRAAFAKVQRAAMDAAVGQARLREGIGEVFRNLARRSQSLLHRQHALLDGMERRTEDPQELADLFRVDHLTTRMRRHAESLTILSGQSPARGWQNPVPFVDVIRAAVAEVEDYTRVSVISAGDAGLAGAAVGDVIHIIAELIENATIYSPPNTPVVIQGGVVGQGYAIDVEDRGFGMSDEKLAEANDRLAEPRPFDPANIDQLGLLVGGQLARRYEIKITLRGNPYGGTTAIVLIPHSIVVAEGFGEPEPARALEGAPPEPGWNANGRQQGPAADADTEPGRARESLPGELAGAGRHVPLPSYAPAPPAPEPAPPASAPPASAPPASAPPAPAWNYPPQPAADPQVRAGAEGPALPRRPHQASPVPGLRRPPPAYPPLPGRFPDARSPDGAGDTTATIQHGWARGRPMSEPLPGQPQGSGAAGPPDAGESEAAPGEPGAPGPHRRAPADGSAAHGPG